MTANGNSERDIFDNIRFPDIGFLDKGHDSAANCPEQSQRFRECGRMICAPLQRANLPYRCEKFHRARSASQCRVQRSQSMPR